MNRQQSLEAFEQAQKYIPGGVDSPVRAFRAVGGQPVFIQRGAGAHIWDVDGNEYIDYVGSWGPLINGHAHPKVIQAIHETAAQGTSFGAPTILETRLASMITEAIPSVELVRFVSSGTEATMSALRLARAYTGRDKIIKFAGGYHGHSDFLLTSAGSAAMTLGVPDSPGVPEAAARNTLTVPYNNIDAVKSVFAQHPGDIAAVIVEPVAGNMGCIPPKPGFLEGLRNVTREYGALLIFDEVITGFRLCFGGVQNLYNITPDLTCLGKIIGGGLPAAAYGGKQEIMRMIAPAGPVYQAGTLSGNPLAMAAGIAQLELLQREGAYKHLETMTAELCEGLKAAATSAGVQVYQTRIGSMFCNFFTDQTVTDYETAKTANTQTYGVFFREMLDRGVYLAPSQFETGFVSLAHTAQDVAATVAAAREVLQQAGAGQPV